MKTKVSIWWEYAVILLFFIGGCHLFVYFKTAGMVELFSDVSSRPFDPAAAHIKATFGGVLFGSIIIWFESSLYPWLSRFFTKYQRRIIWAVCVPSLIFTTVLIINISYITLIEGIDISNAFEPTMEFIGSGFFVSFMVHCFFLSIAVSFIRQLRINFGETVFLNYLFGKYSDPLVEERNFMFLDLNGSTQIAEKLGHIKYSRFLNKCFDDILYALDGYKFHIYQFVGDEVVLTWKMNDDSTGKAIDMYKAVERELKLQSSNYIEQFGLAPIFKGGVSSGQVTATLVGKGNRQMAYHGDVLNTAARLLGQCKKFNKPILFTDIYLESLTEPLNFIPTFLSELKLRGKEETSKIYSPEFFPNTSTQ